MKKCIVLLTAFGLLSYENVSSQIIQHKYDKAGRLVQQTYPNQNTRIYTYDKDGNRIGQKDTACIKPIASFSASQTSGSCPLTVNFINSSTYTGSPTWQWTIYKDSSTSPVTSTLLNPSVTYNNAGSFLVQLKVTDGCGSDTQTNPAYITVTCPCAPPTAKFGASVTSGNCPLSVDFYDSSITKGATKYEWTFYIDSAGTFVIDTAKNPKNIIYPYPGSFAVKLKITDSCNKDSITTSGYINVSCSCPPPTVKFGASKTTGNCPLTVDFYDSSKTTGTSVYDWTFYIDSSGTTIKKTDKNPIGITYNKAGSFAVELKVTDSCNNYTKVTPAYITVICPPVGTARNFKDYINIQVFPNPTEDIVNIVGTDLKSGDYQIELTNVLGQTLQKFNRQIPDTSMNEQLNIKQYPSGIYYLSVNFNSEKRIFKINRK